MSVRNPYINVRYCNSPTLSLVCRVLNTVLTRANEQSYCNRATGCSYITAMVLLTANSMHRPTHGDLSLDSHLVETGLQTIDKMVKETKNKMLQSFQATCTELHQRMQQRRAEAVIIASNIDCSSRFEDILLGIEGNNHQDDF